MGGGFALEASSEIRLVMTKNDMHSLIDNCFRFKDPEAKLECLEGFAKLLLVFIDATREKLRKSSS